MADFKGTFNFDSNNKDLINAFSKAGEFAQDYSSPNPELQEVQLVNPSLTQESRLNQ